MQEVINKIDDLISHSVEAAEKLTKDSQEFMNDKKKPAIIRNMITKVNLASADIYVAYAKELQTLKKLIKKSK